MSTLRTAGELRNFLAETLVGIRDGTIDSNKANAIAKVASQINQSLATEVTTALQLEKMGVSRPEAGSMVIGVVGTSEPVALPASAPADPRDFVKPGREKDKLWCEQCDMRVTVEQALGCKSAHCKAKTLV